MKRKNELLNLIAQDVKNIKEQYKCLNLTKEEFEFLLTKTIKEVKYLENDELFILSVKEKLIKELNKQIKSQEPSEKNRLINDYINDNFKTNEEYINSQNNINKILEFLKKVGYEINPETMIDLLKNNKIVYNCVKVVTEKNLPLIKTNGLENVIINNNLLTLIEIYCDLNNIEISKEFDDFEIPEKNFGLLKMYFKEIRKMPVLNKEQEIELAKRIEEGDEVAREIFIKSNLKLVVSVAKRYLTTGEDFLDIIQNGNLGLIKAIEKFDYRKGYKFSSYATWWIGQSITREYQNKGRTIRFPVHLIEKIEKIKRYEMEFEEEYHRKPTVKEISEKTGFSIERLNEIYSYQKEKISLNYMIGEKEDTEITETIPNDDEPIISTVEEMLLPHEMKKLFQEAGLNPREKQIIMLRYGFMGVPMSLPEIGKEYGITRERVRQIEARAIIKLRSSEKIKDFIIYMQNQSRAQDNLEKYLTLIEIGPKNKIYVDEDLDEAIEKYSKIACYRKRKRQ